MPHTDAMFGEFVVFAVHIVAIPYYSSFSSFHASIDLLFFTCQFDSIQVDVLTYSKVHTNGVSSDYPCYNNFATCKTKRLTIAFRCVLHFEVVTWLVNFQFSSSS